MRAFLTALLLVACDPPQQASAPPDAGRLCECDPVVDAGLDMGARVFVDHPNPKNVCYDNLCGGDTGDVYCSCHDTGWDQRCWSSATVCEVDRVCMTAAAQNAGGVRRFDLDACTIKANADGHWRRWP